MNGRSLGEGECGPIFVVGPPRSGTELMRRILTAHPDVAFCNESHYFDDLRPRLRGGRSPLTRQELDEAVAYFTAIDRHSYGLRAAEPVDPDNDLAADALARGGRGDDVFAAYVDRVARRAGKSIWGEKTPRHVFRVNEILEVYPTAKIVVMLRDYRAVAASYRDWRNRWFAPHERSESLDRAIQGEEARTRGSYSLTTIALLWASAARQGRAMARCHGDTRVRLVAFEAILRRSEATVAGLCMWLGLGFHPGMLQIEVTNSSYVDGGGEAGIDPSIAHRWEEVLTSSEVAYLEWLIGRQGLAFGYSPSGAKASLRLLVREVLSAPFFVARALWANRRRTASLPSYVVARAVALLRRA